MPYCKKKKSLARFYSKFVKVNEDLDSSNAVNQSTITEIDITIYNDSPNNPKLSPNATGYAKIRSRDMFVFQKIYLEFMKLVDSKFL
jgi:hypothetical protein